MSSYWDESESDEGRVSYHDANGELQYTYKVWGKYFPHTYIEFVNAHNLVFDYRVYNLRFCKLLDWPEFIKGTGETQHPEKNQTLTILVVHDGVNGFGMVVHEPSKKPEMKLRKDVMDIIMHGKEGYNSLEQIQLMAKLMEYRMLPIHEKGQIYELVEEKLDEIPHTILD